MPTPATELAALQLTVTELAGQMAWFVQRLSEDDVVIVANKEVVWRQTLPWTEMDLSENYPTPSCTLVTTRITTFVSAYKAPLYGF